MNKNYGFVPSEITSDHYILGGYGSLPKIIVNPTRNWKEWLPKWESQVDKFDTFGCTIFGTLNSLETLLNKLDDVAIQYDFSERFNYILAGIRPPGADPHYVSEIVRKYGVVEQALLPFTDTYEQFVKPDPMEVVYLKRGQDWLQRYSFGHEWVFTSYPGKDNMVNMIREALQYSPICVSVSAWYEENGLFVDKGLPNSHWVMCYGIDDDGGLLLFDSYALVYDGNVTNALKKLHPDHKVQMAKRYYIEAKKNEEKLSWFATILKGIAEALGIIKKKVDALPVEKPIEVKPEQPIIKTNMIEKWAKAIAKWEGDVTGHNAGNLKFSPLIQSFGGTLGRKAQDGGYFAVFPDDGIPALCKFLTLACKDELKSYHYARTFEQFTKIYAGNPPKGYIEGIRKELGCELNTNISTFL